MFDPIILIIMAVATHFAWKTIPVTGTAGYTINVNSTPASRGAPSTGIHHFGQIHIYNIYTTMYILYKLPCIIV